MPLLRAVSRRATPNLTSSSKLGGEDEGGEAPGPGGMKRASSLLRGDSAGGDLATHRGILLKQKGTMLTWPKRFCWTEEGRFCWAEPSTKANKEHGKERGCIIVSEITAVDKVAGAEKPPFQFTVKTDDRTINFAAESDGDLDIWVKVLAPKELSLIHI